ncbi:pannexin-3 [Callorhinchus milii]|uniref:Pannexin n=1 Tax=Callorhinchus milii TaxID=7868 RepID=V9KV30_CALMI|nr:pannexin-3 [Callorhinchus milii]|eukprot:gi/632956925/ref/XP_007894201.1/ PREDICTED: pannexin-3 [Callorhinchus milii]
MSIAGMAAEFILSDSLIREPANTRASSLRLELARDRLIKFISVGLPLLLVSAAFAKEISLRSQISCFPPSNFSTKQAAYVDAICWESLLHQHIQPSGNVAQRSLWIHKVFPYSLLVIAVTMYLPALIWKLFAKPSLASDLIFITDELDKAYNRSIKVAQLIVKKHENSLSARSLIQEELDRARKEGVLDFPLLHRYLACKSRSYHLISIYLMRNFLLLVFIAAACLYLIYCHFPAFFQDRFSCSIKSDLLANDPTIPNAIQCKLTSMTIFQLISVVNGTVYLLLVPMIIYSLFQLCYWDRRFLSVYAMLPAFDLVRRKMTRCALNDLNIILHFLQANMGQLQSFNRLSVLCVVKNMSAQQKGYTLVDMMTLLVGLEDKTPGDGANTPVTVDNGTVGPHRPRDTDPNQEPGQDQRTEGVCGGYPKSQDCSSC